MKTLHISLIKKWYDLTYSGEKQEEYRELNDYWTSRLANKHTGCLGGDFQDVHKCIAYTFKSFDSVKATNGYGHKRPNWTRKFEGIEIREGREEWGAIPGKKYFVIKLGEKLLS